MLTFLHITTHMKPAKPASPYANHQTLRCSPAVETASEDCGLLPGRTFGTTRGGILNTIPAMAAAVVCEVVNITAVGCSVAVGVAIGAPSATVEVL